MRIMDNKPAAALRKASGAKRKGGASGSFSPGAAAQPADSAQLQAVGGLMSISSIGMLLAVQGVDGDGGGRRQAISQGHETLDALDSLKVDVLAGRISSQKIKNLVALAERQRETVSDPQLANLLDHIELRARVELAKLEQQRG